MKKKKGKREEEKEKNDDKEAEEAENELGADGEKLISGDDFDISDVDFLQLLKHFDDDGVYSRTRSKVPDVAKLPDIQDTMDSFCEISDGEHPSSNTRTKYVKSNVSGLGDSRLEKDMVSEDKKPPATSTRASKKKKSDKNDAEGGEIEEARLEGKYRDHPRPIRKRPASYETHIPLLKRQKSSRNQSRIGMKYEIDGTKREYKLQNELLRQEKQQLEEELAFMRSKVHRLERLLEKEKAKLNLAEKKLGDECVEEGEEGEDEHEGESDQNEAGNEEGNEMEKDNKK